MYVDNRGLNTFDKWFLEYKKVSQAFSMPVNELDKDYYYNYYESFLSPRQALMEELKEYYYEDNGWD